MPYAKTTCVITAILLSMLLIVSVPHSTSALDAVNGRPVVAGIVGKLSMPATYRQTNPTEDLLLSAVCDSLYTWDQADGGMIAPSLADGWPIFKDGGRTVIVKVGQRLKSQESTFPDIQAAASCLSARAMPGQGITVTAESPGNTLTFNMGSTAAGEFWRLFAFAPIYGIDGQGMLRGAGSPPFIAGTFDQTGYSFCFPGNPEPRLIVRGFTDISALLAAFAESSVHYATTGLSQSAASVKGFNRGSPSDAVIFVWMNGAKGLFTEKAVRENAFAAADPSFLVLRLLSGRAFAASGFYFKTAPAKAQDQAALKGAKVRLFVNSHVQGSLEALCASMIKSWWELKGASVALVMPKDDPERAAILKMADFDAAVSTAWLEPAYGPLTRSITQGGIGQQQGMFLDNSQSASSQLASSASMQLMKSMAKSIEETLIGGFFAFPLLKPMRSELYRPDLFTGWLDGQPGPLIKSLRDLSSVFPVPEH